MDLLDYNHTKELNRLDLTIKKGDTRNAIEATLQKNGQPIDLTGCNVLFFLYERQS